MLSNLTTPETEKLGKAFLLSGFNLRFVGGCVRDALLGVTPKDLDFCTDATPDEMRVLADTYDFKFLPTGLQHGTVTLVVDSEPFEVTTLRVDIATDGRHAEVEFTRNFKLDAERRDLTMNAMSMDFLGKVYDYFGGLEDLKNNRVRFVGDAAERVKEDYLRVLRYFRFAARFDSNMDQEDLDLFSQPEVLEGLSRVSVERYWQELTKLLDPATPGRVRVMEAMFDTGVAQRVGFTHYDPVTLDRADDSVAALSTMVASWDLDQFLDTWKLSKSEQQKVADMVVNRTAMWDKETVEDILTFNELPRDTLVSTLKVVGEVKLAKYASEFQAPTFPVKGQDLLNAGMKPGLAVGKTLKGMEDLWASSRFTMSKEALLESFRFT